MERLYPPPGARSETRLRARRGDERAALHQVNETATPDASSAPCLSASERLIKAAGLDVSWSSISETCRELPPFFEAQFEAAVRTVLIHASGYPVRISFLLNGSGVPRPAESIGRNAMAQLVTTENVLASCEISDGTQASARIEHDAVLIWIDDLRCPDPHVNPYASWAKGFLYTHHPVLLDALRQRRTDRINRAMIARMAKQRRGRAQVSFPGRNGPAPSRTILFCLYWLDFGGAEAFALQTMQAAREAGFNVVVACDEDGRHRLLERASQVADAIYLLGSFGAGLSIEEAYLRIIRKHQPAVIHIHHSRMTYRLLPAIRALGLTHGVIDTTHILEHRMAGFVGEATRYSEYVDRHHVISHHLADLMTGMDVDDDRIRLGKLHDLSKSFEPQPDKWSATKPLNIAFVGRFQQQKRPYLFLQVAKQLVHRFGRDAFRFTAIGEGRLRVATERLAAHLGLSDLVEFLPGTAPVQETLGHAHVLLIPSDNEGLTLVAFEAVRAGCIVISSDVGAQREIVVPELLVPHRPRPCVVQMVERVTRLLEGSIDAGAVLERQKQKLEENLAEPTGVDVCLAFYREIMERKAIDVSAA